MPERDIDYEIQMLINNIGLTKEEAYDVLGLRKPDHDSSASGSHSEYEGLADDVLYLVEMFPNIPISMIESTLENNDRDIDKSSEILLSWDLVEDEKESSKERSLGAKRHQKQTRKLHKKLSKEIAKEEREISVIASTLNIAMENARELYWTNESDVTKALLSKAPIAPLSIGRNQQSHTLNALDSMPSSKKERHISEYRRMPRNELKKQIDDRKRRIETLRAKSRISSNTLMARCRAQDAATEARELRSELYDLQIALSTSEKIESSGFTKGRNILDLHGCTVNEAEAIVNETIREFKEGDYTYLEIITGVGHHSVGGKPILKNWLRDYFKKQTNLRIQEMEGSFFVYRRHYL